MSNMFVRRFIAAILASVIVSGGFLARGQSQTTAISEAEKGDIVESLLQLETESQATDFETIRMISSDNIGSLAPARVAKHGFSLMEAGQIESLRKDHVVEYVVIRTIDFKDGIVVVKLSRVIEGRPCFGPPLSRERSFTYEFQNGTSEWVGRLVRKPLPFTFSRGLAIKP
jgi:hypothetical protein